MFSRISSILSIILFFLSCQSESTTENLPPNFVVSSTEFSSILLNKHFDNGSLGCSGEGLSPQLNWEYYPGDTKSFIVTIVDIDYKDDTHPDGFLHMGLIDLNSDVNSLEFGLNQDNIPIGSRFISNGIGQLGYVGVCQPKNMIHRYEITVYALSVEKLPEAQPSWKYKDLLDAIELNKEMVLKSTKMTAFAGNTINKT